MALTVKEISQFLNITFQIFKMAATYSFMNLETERDIKIPIVPFGLTAGQ